MADRCSYLFGMSLREPVEDEGVRMELDYMVDCIEAAIAPRKLAEGRTQVKMLAIWDRELELQHMPFTFMVRRSRSLDTALLARHPSTLGCLRLAMSS